MFSKCIAESTLHTLDPFVIEFSQGVGPRWYGLSYAAGFLVGWFVLRALSKKLLIPISVREVGDLVFCMMIGVVVGGRLGHCLFYEPSFFVEFESAMPYWRVLALHKGGMSSHGGMLGVAIGCVWFARSRAISLLAVCDAVAFVAPIGLCFGRLANWVNAELWGKALPLSMQSNPPWWSVKYPDEVFLPQWNGAAVFANERLLARSDLGLQQLIRDECYLGNTSIQERLLPTLTAYWPINFMQALSEGVIVFSVLALLWMSPRRQGVIAGSFCVVYGVLRFVTEQFRQADADLPSIMGITIPMQLSALLVIAGFVFYTVSAKQKRPLVGGWLHARAGA